MAGGSLRNAVAKEACEPAAEEWPWPRSKRSFVLCRERDDDGDAVRDASPSLVGALTPMLWALRLYLMLPVSISPSQRVSTFRWLSWPMALTLCSWLFIAVEGMSRVEVRLTALAAKPHASLLDAVPAYALSAITVYVCALPGVCWAAAAPRIVAFLERWRDLEMELCVLRGARAALITHYASVRRRAWATASVGAALPATLTTLVMLSARSESWEVPYNVHITTFVILGIGFWAVCCRALAGTAGILVVRLQSDAARLGVAGLRAHRRLWRGLAHALRLLGYAWVHVHLVLLALLFIVFTVISFMFTFFAAGHDWTQATGEVQDGSTSGAYGTVGLWLASIAGICSICNSAHVATSQMRGPFIGQLLLVRVSTENENDAVYAEVHQFLDDVKLNSSEVSLEGLATLGRSSILSIFALGFTYLVVLSQFATA